MILLAFVQSNEKFSQIPSLAGTDSTALLEFFHPLEGIPWLAHGSGWQSQA